MLNKPRNKLCLWRDCVLYLGDSLDPQPHRHHAMQCCIALKGQLKISASENEDWQSCQAVIIASDVQHNIANPDGPVCLLYIEKTSNDYRAIISRHSVVGSKQPPDSPKILDTVLPASLIKSLTEAMKSEIDSHQANKLRKECLQIFRGDVSESLELDPRISLLLKYLHEQPSRQFTATELTKLVDLSESRLQHLFKLQIGIPIRRNILWVRLRQVLELTQLDTSLTTASHEAGFSDAAHFSRTFKAMFGITPSSLLSGETGLKPLICDRAFN